MSSVIITIIITCTNFGWFRFNTNIVPFEVKKDFIYVDSEAPS